jgi:hypothetical protein
MRSQAQKLQVVAADLPAISNPIGMPPGQKPIVIADRYRSAGDDDACGCA